MAVFVEIVRLLIVLLVTAAGYELGANGGAARDPVVGAILGALVGYVAGGVAGRLLSRVLGRIEDHVDRAPAAQVLVGGLGAVLLAGLAAVFGIPAVVLLPGLWGWPVLLLAVWMALHAGYRIASRKSEELLHLVGLQVEPLAPPTEVGAGARFLLDSSAVLDGRIAVVVERGFLPGTLVLPRFVLDEMQGLADTADEQRRRRGRRGLELLDELRRSRSADLRVVDDEVPQVADVDAKLIALALRLGASIVTTDEALATAAEVRGVRCLNPRRLSRDLQPEHLPGELVRVPISREGKEPGQGVGFLDDGSMVVVGDAADLVGREVDARLTSSVQTSVGRMFFASPVAE